MAKSKLGSFKKRSDADKYILDKKILGYTNTRVKKTKEGYSVYGVFNPFPSVRKKRKKR